MNVDSNGTMDGDLTPEGSPVRGRAAEGETLPASQEW